MKCVKNHTTGAIQRLSDYRAEELVTGGSWEYCGKEEWKKEVRDVKKEKSSQNPTKKGKKNRRKRPDRKHKEG